MSLDGIVVAICEWFFEIFMPGLLIVGLFEYFGNTTGKLQFKIAHAILATLFALMISMKFWHVLGFLGHADDRPSLYTAILAAISGITVAVVALRLTTRLSKFVSETHGSK